MTNPPDDQDDEAEPDYEAIDAALLAAFEAHRAAILRTVADAEPVTTELLGRLLAARTISMADFRRAFNPRDPADAIVVWSPQLHRGLVTVFPHKRR